MSEKKNVVTINGKEFITFTGLLEMAYKKKAKADIRN